MESIVKENQHENIVKENKDENVVNETGRLSTLKLQKKTLSDDIYEYHMKIKETKENIIKVNKEISKECLKINGKHKWITERESGIYGEKYTYCECCGIDHYNSYYHF